MKQSLGLVEVRGMTAALTVADAMCKTANVQIHKLEKTRGGGWMLVVILGDVQAVQVAVDAGTSVAQGINCYIGQTVIARLSDGLLDTVSPVVKEVVEEVLLDEVEPSDTIAEEDSLPETSLEESVVTVEAVTLPDVEEDLAEEVVSDKKKRPKKAKKTKRKS